MARLCNDLFDPSWKLHRTFSNEIGMSQTLFKYWHCDWRLWPNPVSHTSPPFVGEVWAAGQRRDHTSKKNVQAQCWDVPTLKLHMKVRKMRSLINLLKMGWLDSPKLYKLKVNFLSRLSIPKSHFMEFWKLPPVGWIFFCIYSPINRLLWHSTISWWEIKLTSYKLQNLWS